MQLSGVGKFVEMLISKLSFCRYCKKKLKFFSRTICMYVTCKPTFDFTVSPSLLLKLIMYKICHRFIFLIRNC